MSSSLAKDSNIQLNFVDLLASNGYGSETFTQFWNERRRAFTHAWDTLELLRDLFWGGATNLSRFSDNRLTCHFLVIGRDTHSTYQPQDGAPVLHTVGMELESSWFSNTLHERTPERFLFSCPRLVFVCRGSAGPVLSLPWSRYLHGLGQRDTESVERSARDRELVLARAFMRESIKDHRYKNPWLLQLSPDVVFLLWELPQQDPQELWTKIMHLVLTH